MAGEWTQKRIGDFADVRGGKRLPNGEPLLDFTTEHPYIRLVDVVDNRINAANVKYLRPDIHRQISSYIVSEHDVCLAIVGHTIGLVFYVDQKWHGANLTENAARITNFNGVDPRYLFYVLASSYGSGRIKARIVGSAQGKLPIYSIRDIEVPIPPLDEQRAIAHILGTLDDKIELNRRMSETLEAMARALFQSWFVDFDPVRAKLALSGDEGAKGRDSGLPKSLADLFPARLVNSELGEIPEGWEVGSVADLADVSSGKRPEARFTERSSEASVPLWGGNGPMAFVPESLTHEPILLTGRVGTLGPVFRISTPCWPSDNTLIVRANRPFAFEYLFFQLRQIDYVSMNRGSTQPLLTQTDLKSQRVILPAYEVLDHFSRFAGSAYRRIDGIEEESRTLAALRDALLPKLISGKLRMQDAERIIERSV